MSRDGATHSSLATEQDYVLKKKERMNENKRKKRSQKEDIFKFHKVGKDSRQMP